jgi:thioredoxin reductase
MESVTVDYLIIGAGPAGLQMGYLLQKQGINYAILERGECAGTFFKTFPRHRKLISINKVYTGYDDPEINLRWDWNSLLSDDEGMLFKNYSRRYFPAADDLVRYLNDYALFYGLRILFNKKVTRVYRNARNGEFHVATADGDVYRARTLIVATGLARPFLPDIPGLKSVEVYTTVSVDPKDFENQRVLIIGKGNSAFETGDNLVETAAMIHLASPNPIKMAWATHFVGHLRAVNNNLLDTYQLKSQNATIDAAIREVRQHSDSYHVVFEYTHAEGEVEELVYDRVIACTGFRFNAEIFDASCRPRLTLCDRFPDQTPAWESVNVPDLYFAGTLMQMRDYKRYMSGLHPRLPIQRPHPEPISSGQIRECSAATARPASNG